MRDLTIPQQRHPEKAHRKDNQQPKKPKDQTRDRGLGQVVFNTHTHRRAKRGGGYKMFDFFLHRNRFSIGVRFSVEKIQNTH